MASIKLVMFDQKWKITCTAAQEKVLKDLKAQQYGYQAMVQNPNFKPNLAIEVGNLPTMPNPVSKEEFIISAILNKWLREATETKQQAIRVVKEAEAAAEATAAMAGFVIEKDLAV